MWPECPTKDWRGKCCWLHPRESDPEQGPGGVITSPACLGPVLVWSKQNHLRLLKTWVILNTARATAPATLPRGEAGMKMNESSWSHECYRRSVSSKRTTRQSNLLPKNLKNCKVQMQIKGVSYLEDVVLHWTAYDVCVVYHRGLSTRNPRTCRHL